MPAVISPPNTAFGAAMQLASLASATTVQVVVDDPAVTLSNVFCVLASRTRKVPLCTLAGAAALTESVPLPAV